MLLVYSSPSDITAILKPAYILGKAFHGRNLKKHGDRKLERQTSKFVSYQCSAFVLVHPSSEEIDLGSLLICFVFHKNLASNKEMLSCSSLCTYKHGTMSYTIIYAG